MLRIIHSILVQRSRWCIQDQPLVTQDLKPVSSWVQLFRRLSGTFNHLHLITLSSAQLLRRGAYRDSPLERDRWKESGEEEAWRHKMEALICGIAFKSSSPSSAGAKRNTLSNQADCISAEPLALCPLCAELNVRSMFSSARPLLTHPRSHRYPLNNIPAVAGSICIIYSTESPIHTEHSFKSAAFSSEATSKPK